MRYNVIMIQEPDTFHGQHFLVDREVIDDFIRNVPSGEKVFEIGAGDGRLTRLLADKSKHVVAVETDGRMLPKLRELATRNGRIKVVNTNAIDINLSREGKRIVVVGAIPFHITEPLMQKLARSKNVDEVVLIVGGRFADSITSETSERRGPLANLVLSFFNVVLLRWIKKESFDPPPRTTSALIKMQRKN